MTRKVNEDQAVIKNIQPLSFIFFTPGPMDQAGHSQNDGDHAQAGEPLEKGVLGFDAAHQDNGGFALQVLDKPADEEDQQIKRYDELDDVVEDTGDFEVGVAVHFLPAGVQAEF